MNWKAPALNTVMYRFTEDEVRYILNYGRPVLAHVAVGHRGRRAHERAADPERHRLPEEHPDADGGLRRGRDHLRDGPPAGRRSRGRDANPATSDEVQRAAQKMIDDGEARQPRRGAVQARAELGRLLAAPAATPTAGPTATRSRAAAAPFGPEPHRRLRGAPVPERRRPRRVHRDGLGARQALRAAGPGQRAHARLRPAAHRGADPGHRRVRAGPADGHVGQWGNVGDELGEQHGCGGPRLRLGARDPRHPLRHHRCGGVVRQRLPRPRHQPRLPARLPRGHGRPVRAGC